MNPNETTSKQFSNPLLVSAYDALNTLGEDRNFWLKEIERLAPKTIIDLGCGTGLLTCELAKRGYYMIGIEPASKMLDIARKKQYADKVRWIKGGYEKFDGLKADMVLMTSHVAQFFLDPKKWQRMLKAAYKALNPGGRIIFDSRMPIFPPYQTWPTKSAPQRVWDVNLGPIDWYYKLLKIKDSRVRYQLHFHFINSSKKVTSTDELIFRSQRELTKSLEDAGFGIETVYGDWDGSLATAKSPEMIFVGVRNDVIIKKSKIGQFKDGLGVFANRDFKKGEVVIKYHLKILTKQEYKKLPNTMKDFTHERNGIIYYYSDPERHVNRFKNPNVYPDFKRGADIALRDIKKGEELSIQKDVKEDF